MLNSELADDLRFWVIAEIKPKNKTDLSKHYWISIPFNPRVYRTLHCSVVIFYFPNTAVFYIRCGHPFMATFLHM
jgi:hypothetical protein